MNTHIIMRPVITEKSMQDANAGKFTFAIKRNFGKNVIKNAIEHAFAVTVTDISISVVKGGRKRVGTRRVEKQKSPWKKAIITLVKGQKIDLFDIGGTTA